MWLVNSRQRNAYEIVEYDPKTKRAVLKGQYATFDQKLDVAQLKQSGYELMKENPYAK